MDFSVSSDQDDASPRAHLWGSTPSTSCFAQERYVHGFATRSSMQTDIEYVGNVFEKRLIEAYIAEHGKEPVTGEELTIDDLVDLKSARIARPRPPTLTSIPSLLGVFQEEWDALALETYTLRQTLAQTRQELSTALYQHDAAVRVIARLRKERDEARDALSKISVSAGQPPSGGDAMQVDSTGLPAAVVSRIDETQEKLSKTRRKRPIPEDWASSEVIQQFKPIATSESLYPGGDALSLNASGELALVGGVDGIAGVYSLSEKSIVAALKGGGGAITDTMWVSDKAVISTSSGAVKVFENGSEVAGFNSHAGEVTALASHPTGDIIASVGVDKSYVLYDLSNSTVIAQIFSDSALSCVQFHPDGHLLAAGAADGQIKIFDIKTGTTAASFSCPGPLKALFFSENGTWLASVTEASSSVSIWDLRKSEVVKVLEIGNRVDSLNWDYTGQFLLTGGPNVLTVQQYSKSAKSWTEPLRCAVPAVAVAWGRSAHNIVALNTEGVLTLRPHDEISGSSSESRSESPWVTQGEASNPATNARSFASSRPQLPQLPRMRFPGDGYDYRRPIMSTGVPPPPPSFLQADNQPNVIDLTQDDQYSPPAPMSQTPQLQALGHRPTGATRPPRFGRNIMADVVDLEQEVGALAGNEQQSSPEVQWLGSISRADPPRSQNQPTAPSQYHGRHIPFRGSALLNLLRSENYRLPGLPLDRANVLSQAEVLREEMALRTRDLVGAFRHAMSPFWVGEASREGIDLTIDIDNPDMDVTLVGLGPFNARRTPRTSPAYQAPPAPLKGFTGTAGEEAIVVCPNCDHELGTGDDPLQKQVWVARSCGHVYCGLCTKNRAVTRGKKAATPSKTRPFAKCVVAECGKSVSQPKTMLQIYL
ncbi:WD domain-containing protein [Emydomyces testavorans]|uniref:Pre-mRNA-processing factor 19 n=1 Tax=Emydomyces testavorans TaxID=2070801 RepID=A0AAF0ILU7_9EURO|nr:WD domain-containing protein [Emydomyces testavorans]